MKYRPEIDGLRAVAVILVIAFHLFPRYVPGGFVGVDVFFVISGYLITGIIAGGVKEGNFTFAEFYRRRARRIFPAMAIVLAASLAAGWAMLLPSEYAALAREALAGAAFVPNLLFWYQSGYFDAGAVTKPLLHLWSLGIEEQFYLVWPLAVVWLFKTGHSLRKWAAGAAIVSVAAFLLSSTMAPTAAFYAPHARSWKWTRSWPPSGFPSSLSG